VWELTQLLMLASLCWQIGRKVNLFVKTKFTTRSTITGDIIGSDDEFKNFKLDNFQPLPHPNRQVHGQRNLYGGRRDVPTVYLARRDFGNSFCR
jgi:hypothetical protein